MIFKDKHNVHIYVCMHVVHMNVYIGEFVIFWLFCSPASIWFFAGINCAGFCMKPTHTSPRYYCIYIPKKKTKTKRRKQTRTRHSGIDNVARGSCANGIWPIYASTYRKHTHAHNSMAEILGNAGSGF